MDEKEKKQRRFNNSGQSPLLFYSECSGCPNNHLNLILYFQSIVRMLLISKSFQIKLARHRASRLIQSSFRMVQAIKEAKLLRRQKASITIQKLWRSNRIHSAYNFLRRGVTAFQSVWRFFCCRCQYNTVRSRCIVAQSAVRRYLAIARLSTAVQSNFRHHSFFRQYLRWCSEKRHHLIQKHGQSNRCRDKVRVQVRRFGAPQQLSPFFHAKNQPTSAHST